jgi:membrane protease YdiL (CAAX protease family)
MMNLEALLDPLAVCVLFVSAVVFPWSGVWEFRRLIRWNAEHVPNARVRHYNWLVVSEWIYVAVFLSWWFWDGRQAAALGLVPNSSGWQWMAVGGGAALSAVLVLQMVSIKRSPESLSKVRGAVGKLAEMVPRNPAEQRAFDRLSITAGICEEILFRGFVLVILAEASGTWPAILVSSLLFGLGHIYQGAAGFVKTAMVGLVLALLTVFSGSLFTAIVVHVVLDLVSGRVMSAALTLDAGDSANVATLPGQ